MARRWRRDLALTLGPVRESKVGSGGLAGGAIMGETGGSTLRSGTGVLGKAGFTLKGGTAEQGLTGAGSGGGGVVT